MLDVGEPHSIGDVHFDHDLVVRWASVYVKVLFPAAMGGDDSGGGRRRGYCNSGYRIQDTVGGGKRYTCVNHRSKWFKRRTMKKYVSIDFTKL